MTSRTVLSNASVVSAASFAALLAGFAAAPAFAAPLSVGGGTVHWSQANAYSASGVSPVQRTFLGHTTNPGAPTRGQSNGTVTPSVGATAADPAGTSITGVGPADGRGVASIYTFGFPVTGGAVDTTARTLDVQATGTLAYAQYPGLPAGAPPVITVTNPRVVVTGDTGAVYAAGTGSAGASTYDASTPLFTLNAAAATFTTAVSGAVTIDGLVPAVGLTGVWGTAGQYPAGTAGPDRTPNTFGGFSVVVTPGAAGTPTPAPTPVVHATPAPVIATPAPVLATPVPAVSLPTPVSALADVRWTGATVAQPFKAKRAIAVKIRKRGQWTVLGEGIVKGKRLSLTLKAGTTLEGEYVLRRVSASTILPKSKVVTIGG